MMPIVDAVDEAEEELDDVGGILEVHNGARAANSGFG